MKTLTLGLIKGRHDINEVKDYIFENTIDNLFDYQSMRKIIHQKLGGDISELNLYVTGLTVALIEVVNYCFMFNIKLNLYHFDRDTNNYKKQKVFTTTLNDIAKGGSGTFI